MYGVGADPHEGRNSWSTNVPRRLNPDNETLRRYPQQHGFNTFSPILDATPEPSGTFRNVPEPSATFHNPIWTLHPDLTSADARNLTHRNRLELSGTRPAYCTLQNPVMLHQKSCKTDFDAPKPRGPHLGSAPEPSPTWMLRLDAFGNILGGY